MSRVRTPSPAFLPLFLVLSRIGYLRARAAHGAIPSLADPDSVRRCAAADSQDLPTRGGAYGGSGYGKLFALCVVDRIREAISRGARAASCGGTFFADHVSHRAGVSAVGERVCANDPAGAGSQRGDPTDVAIRR